MKKRSILIVDDEKLTRKALLDGVDWEKIGIGERFEAGSAKLAKEILQKEEIELALIDIEMPEETGLDLLQWIREELKSEIPCAFLTCHASFQYAQKAIKYDCFDYLLKPMDYAEVENLILRMIGKARKESERKEITEYGEQWLRERQEEGKKHEKCACNTDEIIEESVVYVKSHLSEKLSLTDLAYRAGLNPNYFNKVFKERVGETVNKFIINERMKLAAKLLAEGNLKSYAIAESLGYDNYANFVNMFKKTYGESPNSYSARVHPKDENG